MPISGIDPEGKEVIISDDERQRTEVYSRIMGYYSPLMRWNIGKKGEWDERVPFDANTAIGKIERGEV